MNRVPAFALFVLSTLWNSSSTLAASDPLPGHWAAAPATAQVSGHLELRIEAAEDGKYLVSFLGPAKMPATAQPVESALVGGALSVELPTLFPYVDGTFYHPVTLEIQPRGNGSNSLATRFVGAQGKTKSVDFYPADDARFTPFEVPRVDQAGNPVETYVYTPPTAAGAGLPVSTLEAQQIDRELIERAVTAHLTREISDVGALLLMKNGSLVLEEYFYNANRERLWHQNSASKSVTSLLAGVAAAEGKLALDKPVNPVFPEYADTPFMRSSGSTAVTPRQLLRMANVLGWGDTSGASGGAYESGDSRFFNALFSGNWLEHMMSYPVLTQDPDPFFNYNTMVTNLLGATIERVTGRHLSRYVKEKLLNPLGESRSTFPPMLSEAGDDIESSPALAGSSLAIRPLAMAKLGQLVLNRGRWEGEQLVPKDWVIESTSVQAVDGNLGGPGYGYQWWVVKLASPEVEQPIYIPFANGYGNQFIFVIPRYDAVAVFGSLRYGEQSEMSPYNVLGGYLLPALAGTSAPFAPVDITGEDLGFAPLQ